MAGVSLACVCGGIGRAFTKKRCTMDIHRTGVLKLEVTVYLLNSH